MARALDPATSYPYDTMAADLGIKEGEARERLGEFGFEHPVLGPMHPQHIPLAVLREHFPRTYERVAASRGFAVVREPHARFVSALAQRMTEHLGYTSLRLDGEDARREAERACDWVEERGSFADLDYIHFTRQTDYVALEGVRVVGNVFPMDDLATLEAWLAHEAGLPGIAIARADQRLQPRPGFKGVYSLAGRLARTFLTDGMRRAIYPLWKRSGVFAPAAGNYGTLDFGPRVERFITEYYAPDAALYEEATARPAEGAA